MPGSNTSGRLGSKVTKSLSVERSGPGTQGVTGVSGVASTSTTSLSKSSGSRSTSAVSSNESAHNNRHMIGPGKACLPMVCNVNSRSLSMASISSDGSSESHLVEHEDIIALTQDVRSFKEALGKLRKIFQPERDPAETLRVTSHERLSDVLKILRHMLEKYPALQSNDLVAAAGLLIQNVKNFNYEEGTRTDPKEFFEALDGLALAFSSRVSEYLMGDLDSNISMSSASSKTKSCENLLSHDGDPTTTAIQEDEILSPDQIDSLLMLHDQGVDHALQRAKIWAKYAKDVMCYVEKRTTLQLDLARNLTKLVQTCRPLLKEESYLPFQSIYCTALDQDLEMCTSTQTSCGLLQGYKFLEPLAARRAEHEKTRKQLKEIWHTELKKMKEEVNNLRKAKTNYMQKQQEWERCRDAARIAEQGAEIGATGENKLDKRKKLEEEAGLKAAESESHYRSCVEEANDRHRNLLTTKSYILCQIRELVMQCDQTMKAVTVSYFQQQHTLTAPCPVQFQTLCESSRLYEPGSQYMKFVKRLPDPLSTRFSERDPFTFEPYTEGIESVLMLEKQRKSSASLESCEDGAASCHHPGSYKMRGVGAPMAAWSPQVGTIEPSDTESIESKESVKSRDTSPSHSPIVCIKNYASSEEPDPDGEGRDVLPSFPKRQEMSKAAFTHKFRKLNRPSRCRECDSYLYFNGYECGDCTLSCHKKCLETLALQCGHKRLPRKLTTFGVDLEKHLLETGAQIPPLVCKCVSEIDARGFSIKGLYRVSGVKSKVEKLCQAFENGADLVDLSDIHPNVIANVVKLYMRQLPEPLMTFRLYHDFIKVGRQCPAATNSTGPLPNPGQNEWELEAVNQLLDICRKLPTTHHLTLGFLCHHLHKISLKADINNMPASNLAIVFGPTLLRTSEGSASLSSLVDTVHQTRVVELLTKYATHVFGPAVSVLPRDYGRYASNRENEKDEVTEEVMIPGVVLDQHHHMGPTPDELHHGSVSDDEDPDPIPDFLLPDWSAKVKKSPLLKNRGSSPPKITKTPLKNFSGLEGVRPNFLATQDSVEFPTVKSSKLSDKRMPQQTSQSSEEKSSPVENRENSAKFKAGKLEKKLTQEEGQEHDDISRTKVTIDRQIDFKVGADENKVKIQVPGLPPLPSSLPPSSATQAPANSQMSRSTSKGGLTETEEQLGKLELGGQ